MKFTKAFKMKKTQAELDFVDVPLHTDIPLFIDPYAISKRNDNWSIECHNTIVEFFQRAVDAIRANNDGEAIRMFSQLKETNETHLGLSIGRSKGRGVSGGQAQLLHNKLKESSAVRTGFLSELADCELLVEGIGPDKISDITTRIIKKKLIEYTTNQCNLLGIDTDLVASGYSWDRENQCWVDSYENLPVYKGNRILLVPKAIARWEFSYDFVEYYNRFVLEYLQIEHLNANSSLVQTLKKGKKRVVYKTVLKKTKKYPCSKEYIYKFSKKHPDVLEKYKKTKAGRIKEISNEEIIEGFDAHATTNLLIKTLRTISTGSNEATKYHDLIIGVLEFIFYPLLMYPKKEVEIHSGRKRIDISFNNAAQDGFFHNLPNLYQIPSIYIMAECKNYKGDPQNPELDQLSGRFAVNRGQFGLLICRYFDNKKLFSKRCTDTYKDGRGAIIALDDEDVIMLLKMRADENDDEIDKYLHNRFRELTNG